MNGKLTRTLFNFSLIVLIISSVMAVGAADPQVQWYRTYGTNATNEWAYSVQVTHDGGYILAGAKSSPTSGLDIYLVKTDPSGVVEWERTYPGYLDDAAFSVIECSDGGYAVAGYTRSYGSGGSDAILMKINALGTLEWFKTFGGASDDRGQAVRQTSDGGYILAGSRSTFSGLNYFDVYLVKTDPSGNMVWSRTIGNTDYDSANDVRQTADGGYIVAGSTGLGQRDALLIKTNSTGHATWSKTFGGMGLEEGYSVQQTSDGGYVLGGITRSFGPAGDNAYIVKTDSSGNLSWYNYFGGSADDRAYSVIQTSDNEYLLVGSTRSFGIGFTDVFLVKVSQTGNLKAISAFGGAYDDIGYSAQELEDGSCIIAGETKSFSPSLSQDAYLIRTNIFIDSKPPQVVGATPHPGALVKEPSPSISATFMDLGAVDTSTVSITLDSEDITPSCAISPAGFTFTPAGRLAEGLHTVVVELSDTNGNRGSYSWSFSIDTTAPSIFSKTPTDQSSTFSTRPLISANFSDVVGVNVTGIIVILDNLDITSQSLVTNTYIQYLPPAALPQGTHAVMIAVPDLAGNAATVSWTFRIDTTYPNISSISPNNGTNIYSFGDALITISASYSDNFQVSVGSVRLFLDGADITNRSTVTGASITYTGNVSPGDHTVRLIVADAAGNTSTSTINFTVTNVITYVVIAVVALALLLVVLAALMLRKGRRKPSVPKWEEPTPPPPPAKTYIPEVEYAPPVQEVREISYTEPLPPEQPPEPPKQAEVPTPAVVEERPSQPEALGVAIREQEAPPEEKATPTPPSPEKPPEKIRCPSCGATNTPGATRCWYCDSPLA